jgi:hypothetical protein
MVLGYKQHILPAGVAAGSPMIARKQCGCIPPEADCKTVMPADYIGLCSANRHTMHSHSIVLMAVWMQYMQ